MSSDKTLVDCGELLTISQVATIYPSLCQALEVSLPIELALESIQKVDTAGLQLLVALIQEVQQLGGHITCRSPSSALVDAANTLGLAAYLAFEDPIAC